MVDNVLMYRMAISIDKKRDEYLNWEEYFMTVSILSAKRWVLV